MACKDTPRGTVAIHVVYKYYTNMPVNGKGVYLEPFVMSTTQKVVLEVFSFSGVTTDVLGRSSTCAE